MTTAPSLEKSQFLIASQLTELHLTETFRGGESIRHSVEADHYKNKDEPDPQNTLQCDTELEIKLEDSSEDGISVPTRPSTPGESEGDEATMMNTKTLEQQARFGAPLESDDLVVIDEVNLEERRAQLKRDMEAERQRFTGASSWAPAEERLFELLFMREHLAMMPRHWGYDFQGVPFQDHVFHTSKQSPPVIYAHSRKTEFQATKGMMNLIDLSSKVRTLLQSGFEAKAPGLIEKTLNDFLAWSAADGGYQKLEIIPNLIAEVVESNADHVTVIKSRMDALVQLHREFLRADRKDHGWQGVKAEVLDQGFLMAGSPPRSARSRGKRCVHAQGQPTTDLDDAGSLFRRMAVGEMSPQQRAALAATTTSPSETYKAAGQKRKRSPDDETGAPGRRKSTRRTLSGTSSSKTGQSPRTPPSSNKQSGFLRRPPVVSGLFIINSSVFLCTLDAAKEGSDAYVSWHAEIAFTQTRQCVWHALTVALVVCLARDELMTRLADFETLPEVAEEDPDL